ncbi:MAG: tetratricopeptide repeat protein [Candidatus Promineifilaceae bacterium]|nr:tetratricopeptide repeat protein [Candidatus Promineifilaceae bacterium]
MDRIRKLITPQYIMVVSLIIIWLMVLATLPAFLPLQLASWLAFIALLITPGYLLGDIITWKLKMDAVERLALALPVGMAILAVPGTVALVLHLDIHQLAYGWAIVSGLIILTWILHEIRFVKNRREHNSPWDIDEIILFGLIFVAFLAVVPTLNLYKIDGDAYAVNSFAADALAGLPLNETEPIFGTDLGPGVRMVFNQSLSLNYLWSYFSVINPNTLIAAASKAVLALWAILASYTLGKSAGNNSRRFGLLTAGISLLIYMAAPFLRGDNVSLFFFERINADKFMVPVTMLPVIFAFAMRFIRDGGWRAWLAAAVSTFAVSTIHPLIAAMLALAIGTFGIMHLLMNLRQRSSWLRVVALSGLAVIVMVLPLVQLVLSQSEAELARSYPSTFEGWDIGEKQVPALPFFHVTALDYYGPLPEYSEMEATDVYESTNPFLIWRFALNMDRRRLILFDIDNYISDPSLIMEPPYFLALLLLPMFLFRLRRDVAAQFVVGVSIGVMIVMFSPIITPLIGSFVMPWILWRFIWIIPYALIFAMAAQMIMGAIISLTAWLQKSVSVGNSQASAKVMSQYAALVFLLLATLLLSPSILSNIKKLNGRIAFAYSYPTPNGIFSFLNKELEEQGPGVVLAEQDLSVTLPAFVADAHILAHRMPTTSEVFPADQQDIALRRLLDQHHFFSTPFLTEESIETLQKYDVRYVVAQSGSGLDLQFRMAPESFTWLTDNEAYSLYAVNSVPEASAAIKGNTAMAERDWDAAAVHFEEAITDGEHVLLAQAGLAELARRDGEFDKAQSLLQQAIAAVDAPILHYKLGQIHAQQGHVDESIAEFDLAQKAAPNVARFHIALGDACLNDDLQNCAAAQYRNAVNLQGWPDQASLLIAEADLWRQRGLTDRGLPLYEQAARLQPNEYNLFLLISVYRELGLFEEAAQVVRSMRILYPLSAEVITVQADLATAQEDYDTAVYLLRHAIWLQELQVQESNGTHLALAQVLLAAGRLDEAAEEIAFALGQNSYTASGHTLRGNLFHERSEPDTSIRAYQRAFELDPTQIGVYVALSNGLRRSGGTPNDVMVLLRIALAEDSDESTLLLALGDQWQRLGDAEAAIDAYQSALEQMALYGGTDRSRPLASANSRAFAFSRIAGAYEDLGKIDAAMSYHHSAVAAAPAAAWPKLLLGDAMRRQNETEAAIEAYESALSLDNNLVDGYIRLADLYSAAGEPDRAASLYQRALDLTNPTLAQNESFTTFASYPARPLAADALYASDESFIPTVSQNASSALAAASNLAQNGTITPVMSSSDVFALAQIYQGRSQGDQALQLYLQRLAEGQETGESPTILARYHKEIGDLYLTRNDLHSAIAAYEESIRLDSWSPSPRLGLAEAFTLQSKLDEAVLQLQTAVSLSPGAVEAQIALANILDEQGKTTEAMTIYINTARNHPGNSQATLALARAWQARSRWDRAEQNFRDTIEKNPGAADAYVGLAEIHLDKNELEEAEALLNQARKIDYNNVSSYIRLGDLEQRRGDTREALAWYQHAATLPAADQSLNLTLIDSLIQYGDYETAHSYTKEALQLRPDDTELLLRRGRIEQIYGQYDEALDTFTEAQVNQPDNERLYVALAELYQAQGQIHNALASYQQAMTLLPTESSYYVIASQLWASQDQVDQAQETLLNGLNYANDTAALYSTLSTLHLQQGRPDLALDSLSSGIDHLGDNTQMFLAMGDYYVNRGNFDQVQSQFDQALETQPDVADVHIALGDLYLLTEELDKAIDAYRDAITLDPATPGHYLALGNAFQTDGNLGQAEDAYRLAISTAPTLVESYISLTSLLQAQGKWIAAEEVYEQGLAMAPTSGELLTQYATLKLTQGKRDEAIALLDDADVMAPTAATFIRRAAIYEDLDLVAEAKADLEKALELEPATVEALVALGDLYRDQGDETTAEEYYIAATRTMPGIPTGYLRMASMAREVENRDAVVYWNDLARQSVPGGLARPENPILPSDITEQETNEE